MPYVVVDGIRLHYQDEGPTSGSELPAVVFSHSYLFDHRHFESQIATLAQTRRVVAYDHRNHGRSHVVHDPFAFEAIYRDGLGLLEQLRLRPVDWVGLSTGGFVGLRLAARRPELVRRLVLMDTSASIEAGFRRLRFEALLLILRWAGFRPVLGSAMRLMFSRHFLRDPTRAAERARWADVIQRQDRIGLMRFGQAILSRPSARDELRRIRCPTLVMVGEEDRATPPEQAEQLVNQIEGARLVVVPNAGHLSTVEAPARVNQELAAFLTDVDSRTAPAGT
jgi:pimeloyl-ACP methyl ester carboxylesterase